MESALPEEEEIDTALPEEEIVIQIQPTFFQNKIQAENFNRSLGSTMQMIVSGQLKLDKRERKKPKKYDD
jgi:single-stranded DNA-binding protein